MKTTHHKHLAIIALSCLSIFSYAQTRVNFNEYRDKMGGEKDARTVFKTILDEYKDTENLTVTFAKQRYDFYPDASVKQGQSSALELIGRKGVTIEGNGAEFVCHGIMGISRIDGSSDISFKDFSVDWDRTLTQQCTVLGTTDEYMDVSIDSKKYPHRLVGDKLLFIGEGWELPIINCFNNVYDPNGDIQYNTWDGTIGQSFIDASVEQIGHDKYRFHYPTSYKPAPGSIILLFCGHYLSFGVLATRSSNLLFQNFTIYHSMGPGINGIFCDTVIEKNVKIIANKEKGRVFSTEADAQHYRNCKGLIHLDGCECSGQADDFINVHGNYYKVKAKTGPKSIAVEYRSKELNASEHFAPGEQVAFLHPVSGQREYYLTIESVSGQELVFTEDLPSGIDATFHIENYTWTPEFIFENNTVTKGNRARGVLLTTPKKVIVRNNYFHSAGTAILIEGDIDVWLESGGNTDVDIYGNVFDNCLTSGNRDGNRWQWGDGTITITPSHRPVDADAPAYHRNIRIHNNEFRMFDNSIMRACSVDGLQFKNNKIVRTYDYKPYTYYKDTFTLEGCRNVVIKGNKIDKDFNVRSISTTLMHKDEVKVQKGFTVK